MRKARVNIFGERLDRNGYAPSIIPGHDEMHCKICGANGRGKMDRHEVYFGRTGNREVSKREGFWCWCCHDPCHQGSTGVHQNHELCRGLQLECQLEAEKKGLDEDGFRQLIGRSYK